MSLASWVKFKSGQKLHFYYIRGNSQKERYLRRILSSYTLSKHENISWMIIRLISHERHQTVYYILLTQL